MSNRVKAPESWGNFGLVFCFLSAHPKAASMAAGFSGCGLAVAWLRLLWLPWRWGRLWLLWLRRLRWLRLPASFHN